MVFYAIAKFLEEQDRRREEKMRWEEERERQFAEVVSEARNEGRMEGIDLVLKNPNLQQYPDLHERIAKELEEALGEDERGDTPGG